MELKELGSSRKIINLIKSSQKSKKLRVCFSKPCPIVLAVLCVLWIKKYHLSELTLDRGDQINSLEDKSVKMQNNAQVFKKRAAETKRHFCFQHYRNILIIIAILAVRFFVLALKKNFIFSSRLLVLFSI